MQQEKSKELVIPQHIGIIMDGNGRWAKKRKLPRTAGHKKGADVLRKIADYALTLGVRYLTIYAFSTENWKRPQAEIDAIMKLLDDYLNEARNYIDKETRIVFIGDKSPLSKNLQDKMTKLEADSAKFSRMTVFIAINYGGRAELCMVCKKLAQSCAEGYIKPEDITEDLINNSLYTGGAPDADLIIRPSGELRLSNFLIWQSAYSEFYFSDVLWPEFKPKDLDKAIESYNQRNRRFGGV